MISNCDDNPQVVAGVTQYTPSIPKFYWDVDSQEQGIKQLCKTICMVIDYLNEVADQVNLDTADIADLRTIVEDELPKLSERISAVEEALSTLVTSMLVYDPTKGKFTGSESQARRMLQILATPADENLTVETIAESGITVEEFAKRICGEYVNDSFKRMAGMKMPEQEG